MSVHDSQAHRKMDVTREHIRRVLEPTEILLSIQTGFSLVNAAVVCTAGVNNIRAELVQAGGEDVIIAFTTICNKIWQTGEWLIPWTQSLDITLPKKGNLQQCQNYQTVSLISHPSKVMLKIILRRLKPKAEKIIAEEQAGFRAGRNPQSRSSTYAFYVRNIASTSKTSTMSS